MLLANCACTAKRVGSDWLHRPKFAPLLRKFVAVANMPRPPELQSFPRLRAKQGGESWCRCTPAVPQNSQQGGGGSGQGREAGGCGVDGVNLEIHPVFLKFFSAPPFLHATAAHLPIWRESHFPDSLQSWFLTNEPCCRDE